MNTQSFKRALSSGTHRKVALWRDLFQHTPQGGRRRGRQQKHRQQRTILGNIETHLNGAAFRASARQRKNAARFLDR